MSSSFSYRTSYSSSTTYSTSTSNSKSNFTHNSTKYSSATSSRNGVQSGSRRIQTTNSNPSGTRMQMASQRLGEPGVMETKQFDSEGRQISDGGRVLGMSDQREEVVLDRRIEDVSDEPEK